MIPSGNGCFYTAGVLLLLLLQGLALDHISLLHVHPYLPPVMVAVLAMFEGAYGGMGVALAMGLLFDLTQPGLIPCFHILVFLLAALARRRGQLPHYAGASVRRAHGGGGAGHHQWAANSADDVSAGEWPSPPPRRWRGGEILVTLPLTALVYLPFRWVRRRIYSSESPERSVL